MNPIATIQERRVESEDPQAVRQWRRRLVVTISFAVFVAVCAGYIGSCKPSVDKELLKDISTIAARHGLRQQPDAPDSVEEDNYVRLTRTFYLERVKQREMQDILQELDRVCPGERADNGFIAPSGNYESIVWFQSWDVFGQQIITLTWDDYTGAISIEYFCQKRNINELIDNSY